MRGLGRSNPSPSRTTLASLLADHNFSRPLVLLLRGRRHDVVTSREIGLDRASDGLHLLESANLRRILLTYNERDFLLLHDAWLRWSMAWGVQPRHAGVIAMPQRQRWSPSHALAEIETVLGRAIDPASEGGMGNQLWMWRPARGWFRVATDSR